MSELTDTDEMPFGKYKGTPMSLVPADYLHYLWANGMANEIANEDSKVPSPVALYIRTNLAVMVKELPIEDWSI